MRLRSFLPASLALALALGVPATTLAHTELAESSPADGAQLDAPPSEVVLTFEGEVSAESAFTVTDATGATVGTGSLDLDVAERNVLRADITATEVGTYTAAYAVVAEDGDTVEGEVTFTVGSPTPSAQPDTAVPAHRGSNAFVVGLALVAGAMALAVVAAQVAAGAHRRAAHRTRGGISVDSCPKCDSARIGSGSLSASARAASSAG